MVSRLSTLQNLTWRLTPTWRKTLLVLHVISGIGWMGVDTVLSSFKPWGRTPWTRSDRTKS